ncbi:MAG: hypothetical protein RLZZ627_1165 [Pseudomonadota bacterium]|jgi:sulfur relay (sulfurtransferase) DsrF/TusC family protein
MRSELLLIVRVGPDVRQVALEVLSEILTFAAFDVPLRLLFLDQAAKLLSSETDSEIHGMISALSLYGVRDVFVERESLTDWGVTEESLSEKVMTISRADVFTFIRTHRGVMSA